MPGPRFAWRRESPPAGIDLDGPELTVAAAPAGSLVMWHSGTAHMARANRGSEIRVGLNAAYYPPWFNNWVEGGHQPIWPETFERMPEEHRGLVTGKQGRSRCEAYEVLV